MTFVGKWRELEATLNKISQTQKDKYCMIFSYSECEYGLCLSVGSENRKTINE